MDLCFYGISRLNSLVGLLSLLVAPSSPSHCATAAAPTVCLRLYLFSSFPAASQPVNCRSPASLSTMHGLICSGVVIEL